MKYDMSMLPEEYINQITLTSNSTRIFFVSLDTTSTEDSVGDWGAALQNNNHHKSKLHSNM